MSPARDRTPRLVSGVDLRGLELDPTDAFVLSCVDGASREPEIVEITGLSRDQVSEILSRLFELGVISLSTDLPPAPNPSRAPAPSTSGAFKIGGPIRELYQAGAAHHPAAPETPAAGGEPGVELDPRLQSRILTKFGELSRANHYQLLGVPEHAELKVIKRAYYEFATVFHPDRHFRKALGSFRGKLEQVFTRVTEAYGVLSRGQSRAEYDRYLTLSNRTREFDDGAPLIDGFGALGEPESALGEPSSFAPTRDARRRALARKLGHSSAPPARSSPPSSSAPPSTPPSSQAWAKSELERRYHERAKHARDAQLDRYLVLAATAAEKKDWVATANALRLACALQPGDTALATRLAELDQKAVSSLWQEYLERARYEEGEGQYLRAAHSYERAAAGHRDARLFERAAACLLAAGRDIRRACEHARTAVQLAPDNVKCRLTLARCFLGANMHDSALAELERAQSLAPKDKSIKDLIRQVERSSD
ncbi:MAG TPA: DnaJ domain-containing protein [Polyangiaceae bacterium]|jgi:curved DNA-binding protein CbpA